MLFYFLDTKVLKNAFEFYLGRYKFAKSNLWLLPLLCNLLHIQYFTNFSEIYLGLFIFFFRKFLCGFIFFCSNQVLTQFKQVVQRSQGRRNLEKQRYRVSIVLIFLLGFVEVIDVIWRRCSNYINSLILLLYYFL